MPTGTTWIAELKNGAIAEFELTPEEVGLKRAAAADLKGGEAAHNAEALRDVLKGGRSAFRDAAAMTAGAALLVAGKAKTIKDGVRMAQVAIDDGAALTALDTLVKVSNG